MSKLVFSKASERHIAAMSEIEEVAFEIQHWLKSSSSCIAEIRDSLKVLRNARAQAKRDIHMVRASVENKLKELETEAESNMAILVKAEEETLMKAQKKLMDQRQKLEFSEATIQKGSAGIELTRNIQEAKQRVTDMRQSIITNKTTNRPSTVEFIMHTALLPFVNGESDLGTIQVKSNSGVIISTSVSSGVLMKGLDDDKKTNKPEKILNNSTVDISTQNFIPVRKRHLQKSRLNASINVVKDFEKNSQTFFQTAKHLPGSENSSNVNKFLTKNNVHTCLHKDAKLDARNGSHITPTKDHKKERSKSAKTRDNTHFVKKLDTRVTTSAREDSRAVPNHESDDLKHTMKYLNNTDYIPYEEQGPEQNAMNKITKKEKLSVSYAQYDIIKEITALQDDRSNKKRHASEDAVDIVAYPEPRNALSTCSGDSSRTLSSVSYKPSHAHASTPMYVPECETWQSKSQFMYTARFHTKKHPEDTDLCRLTSIVVLDNGQIVIADINHLRVMLFGPDFTYLGDIECPSPCGSCIVKNDIVAVTLFHNRKILLLKVCMLHLERHKEIHVHCPETLYAVKWSEKYAYVLCFAGHVHVVNDAGKQVNLIETHIGSGMARHLELDGNRKRLYISGLEKVTCFLNKGDICWQFTGKTNNKTFNPGGIVLHNNRLFVTDWGNHRVLEISLDGTFVRDVIVDNLQFPHAMAIHRSTGRMFITQSNMFRQEARSRSVKVFSIK